MRASSRFSTLQSTFCLVPLRRCDANIRKAVVAVVTKAGVRRRRSVVHDLRHTFASLLLRQGESLMYVKEQMGHGSIQVTADVDGHLVPGGNRSAVDRLEERPSAGVAKSLQSNETTLLKRPA